MQVIIIPGFGDHPGGSTFTDLREILISRGHMVNTITWPYFPNELDKYSLTATINYAQKVLRTIKNKELVILGFSMGGIIATFLAANIDPKGLGLIVSPYQAGTGDDLEGKYKAWKEDGYREIVSSKFGKLQIPFSFIEDANKYNSLDIIHKIKSEKLFVVGENDTKVPLMATRKLFDKANQPKKWCQIPEMEHLYQHQPEKLKKVNEIISNFVDASQFDKPCDF